MDTVICLIQPSFYSILQVPSIQRLEAKLLFIFFLQLLVIPNNVATNIPVHAPFVTWVCVSLGAHDMGLFCLGGYSMPIHFTKYPWITLQNGCD